MLVLQKEINIFKLFLVLIIMGVFGSVEIAAQTQTITGTILESSSNTTLPGANIYFESNNSKGVISDFNGYFIFPDVPLGKMNLVVSYVGFETKIVPIDVTEDRALNIEIVLSPTSIIGEEVIISAQLLGQAKAINQQLSSESIAQMVSSDKIQELPDVNAAEAISRLPGISINRSGGEGQKVVVRGLDPKFSAITINGMRLPSNSGTDRSVDLSLISPEILDGIEVYKSPLPDMDAESVGGTINLRLRKAPKQVNAMLKGLWGYNPLNEDYGDYKGVAQYSRRIFDNKIGIVGQASLERFNRGGDFLSNGWRLGPEAEDGSRSVLGTELTFENQMEVRKRLNSSLGIDFSLGTSNFSLLGLYSRTNRDRFSIQENYAPSQPGINFIGREIESALSLASFSLQAEHPTKWVFIDWGISNSISDGETPYNFEMFFNNNIQPFSPDLDRNAAPSNYYNEANIKLPQTFLRSVENTESSTNETTRSARINLKFPFDISSNVKGYLKVGGKYTTIDRERNINRLAENFYYLGGVFTRNAINNSSRPLTLLEENPELIGILSFNNDDVVPFINEFGEQINIQASIDPDLMRQWYEDQRDILNDDRAVVVDRYRVEESISAFYTMAKFEFFQKLTIIPGFRYEYSDNIYASGASSLNGRYGVNGFYRDTTTTQSYGEFLPHLHAKLQMTEWLDIRASFSNTLARPDFNYITPRTQFNPNSARIISGNPNLRYAKSTNYDLFLSAYNGKYGLITIGGFYKTIDNIFYPWRTNLVDQETADAFGFSNYKGWELRSFTNSGESTLKGYEIDVQTGLKFLPSPLNRFLLSVNYSRLYSETETYFLTAESKLINVRPPIFETTYTNNVRRVNMPDQSPHVFNMSVGYDYGSISARVSGAYQGSKVSNFSLNQDFDSYDLEFWRWDASLKYRIKPGWSAFLNLNNFSTQKDISYVRSENFTTTIENYGMTATAGIQYSIR